MKFVILGFDGPEGATKRKIYRPAHLAKLDLLHSQQRILLAGPLTDGAGSLQSNCDLRRILSGGRGIGKRRPVHRQWSV